VVVTVVRKPYDRIWSATVFHKRAKLMLKNKYGEWVLYKKVDPKEWPPSEIAALSKYTGGKEYRLDV
jgi:hypothetical protein